MRVAHLMAGIQAVGLLATVLAAGLAVPAADAAPPAPKSPAAKIPAAKPPGQAPQHKVTCLCDCPDDRKVQAQPVMPRRVARRAVRRMAARPYYRYGAVYNYEAAAPIYPRDWHGEWRAAPDDARLPNPLAYDEPAEGPPPAYSDDGLHIDNGGWTGGVGYGASGGGGGGGGFVDGYGQVHFANGGGAENGPTYNDYNQSFQSNPSVPGPFQPRLMGGLAPPPSSSK